MTYLIEVDKVEKIFEDIEKALTAIGAIAAAEVVRHKFSYSQECIFDGYYTERQKHSINIISSSRASLVRPTLSHKGNN